MPSRPAQIEVYPHPFTTATTIQYTFPATAPVTVAVYDLLGREVTRLAAEMQAQGTHHARFDADGLPAGIYLVRLRQRGHVQTQPVVLAE